MEELLKVQGPTKVKGMGCQEGLPRLPEMHGQRATTSVWPSVHLRGAGAPKHPLIFDRRVATTASDVPAAVVIATRPDRGATG